MTWNLRHLAYVAEAAKAGSIAAAGERLSVSQAAVSAAINNIEAVFGVMLFQRKPGKGLLLTPTGATLMAQIETLLQNARDLEKSAALLSTRLSGTIRLGCFPTAVPHVVPPIMEALHRKYSAMTIDLHEHTLADLSSRLREGQIDAALTYKLSLDPSLKFEQLFAVNQQVAVAANDELARGDHVSLFDLAKKPMILLDLPVCRERILQSYQDLGLKPRIHFQTASTTVAERLVASGQGYAMFGFRPETPTADNAGPIRYLRVTEDLPQVEFGIATTASRQTSRALGAFIDVVRSTASRWAFS